MKINYFVNFMIVVVFVAVFGPLFVNKLMFLGDFKVAGDQETWISFLGTFWGAIIGGIISGSLTLFGVYLTIERQKQLDFDNKYPKLTLMMFDIRSQYTEFQSLLETQPVEMNIKEIDNDKIIRGIKTLLNHKEEIKKLSAEISSECFLNAITFYHNVEMFNTKHQKILTNILGFHQLEKGKEEDFTQLINEGLLSAEEAQKCHDSILDDLSRRFNRSKKNKIFTKYF